MFAADWAPVITIPLIATAGVKEFPGPQNRSSARHSPRAALRRAPVARLAASGACPRAAVKTGKGIISSKMVLIRNERLAGSDLTPSTTRPTQVTIQASKTRLEFVICKGLYSFGYV